VAARDEADGQVFNLGGERAVSLLELAQLVIEANGGGEYRVVPFPEDREAIDIGDYFADYSRARAQLGWQPAVPLAEGLARTIAFYREHGPSYWDGV
jgi:UDP-glucose 4-epimerase